MANANVVYGGNLTFDHNAQEWSIFKERFESMCCANDLTEDSDKAGTKRRSILLTTFVEETYRVAKDLVFPKTLNTVEYKTLIDKLDAHFESPKCSFAERYKFYKAEQRPGEDLGDWAARVRSLAQFCGFTTELDTALRDRFVLGLENAKEREKLFVESVDQLTFSKALHLAQATRSARLAMQATGPAAARGASGGGEVFAMRAAASPATDSANTYNASRKCCAVCGYKNHTKDKCRYVNYTCKKCNAKGHLSRVCKVSDKFNFIAEESDDIQEGGLKMYCHLCHIEMSPTHDSSSGHRAARQLVAVAIDRLGNYLAASEDAGTTNTQAEVDKTVKTEAVGFCDSCNVVVPVAEHAAHLRRRDHALALLKEQRFEELVHAYVGEGPKLEPTEQTDAGAIVDGTEVVKTYTCNICNIEVPQIFKPEHERGSRHRTSRGLTLAASRRARDMISTSLSDGHKGKFTGKMMKKLLKAYTGENGECDDEKTENVEAEVEPTIKPKRLTAKEYFTDVLPYLPYVGSFYTLIIDNTDFVTIQIGNETVKIHVNHLNGLCNFEMNGGYYTTCRLCDGFTNTYYCSIGQQDKCHVMSLGHIKNVLSPIESVHLIRKIDDSHSICGLCNVQFASHLVDNHILKDTRHSVALSEALDKGREYKESKDDLKIIIYAPPTQKQSIFMKPYQFNNNQIKWNFGVPQQPKHSGTLFGSTQNTGFGSAQNTGFGSTQNTGFGSAQNTGFGSTQNTGFASAQTAFGTAQNSSLGGAKGKILGVCQAQGQTSAFKSATQNNTTAFGYAQNTNFSAQNQGQTNARNTGSTQNTTTLGTVQNNIGFFGNSQTSSTGSGAQNKKTLFGNAQNNTTTFGSAQLTQTHAQQNPVNNGESHSNSTVFGSKPPQNQDVAKRWSFGDVKNQHLAGLQSQSHANGGNPQNNAFVNAQSPSQNKEANEPEHKVNNFGDAQAQSNKVHDPLISKSNTIHPTTTPRSYNYSSSSDSDEDCI